MSVLSLHRLTDVMGNISVTTVAGSQDAGIRVSWIWSVNVSGGAILCFSLGDPYDAPRWENTQVQEQFD